MLVNDLYSMEYYHKTRSHRSTIDRCVKLAWFVSAPKLHEPPQTRTQHSSLFVVPECIEIYKYTRFICWLSISIERHKFADNVGNLYHHPARWSFNIQQRLIAKVPNIRSNVQSIVRESYHGTEYGN